MYGVDKLNVGLSGAVSVRNKNNTSTISESGTFTHNGVKLTWNCNIMREEHLSMHEENNNTLTDSVMSSADKIEYCESPLTIGLEVANMPGMNMDCTDEQTEGLLLCATGSRLSNIDDDIFTGTGPVEKQPTFNEIFRKFQATSSLKNINKTKIKKKKFSSTSAKSRKISLEYNPVLQLFTKKRKSTAEDDLDLVENMETGIKCEKVNINYNSNAHNVNVHQLEIMNTNPPCKLTPSLGQYVGEGSSGIVKRLRLHFENL